MPVYMEWYIRGPEKPWQSNKIAWATYFYLTDKAFGLSFHFRSLRFPVPTRRKMSIKEC
jgi:hypothetical protein